MDNKIPPPVYALVIAACMWMVDKSFPNALLHTWGSHYLAVVIFIAGAAIDANALWRFIRQKTTVNPLQPNKARALVVSGMYRYSRNPMYLGMLLLLIAWGCYLGNPWAFVLIPGFVWVMNHWQIVPEERALQAVFGDEYIAYCERVRRWL